MRLINDKLLTKRENEIFMLLVEGYTHKQIAETLEISISTVKTHVENLYDKLNIHDRVYMLFYAIKNKIIEL